LFNKLELQEPAIAVCPTEWTSPPHPRLSFRGRRGGKVIAYTHVRPTGCPRADMVVGGHRYAALDLSDAAGRRLLDLLKKIGAL
jgi:hypothetical protein